MAKMILVAGLGTFGMQTALALQKGGATVIAADRDEKATEQLNGLVTKVVCIDINDVDAMEAAGLLDVDVAVVALRQDFATTVLAVHLFHQHGIPEILVHVENEREGEAIRSVGATAVIFPERDMAERIAGKILLPDLADHIPIGEDVGIIEVACPPDFVGKSLAELDIRKRYNVTVIAIKTAPKREGGTERVDVAPSPENQLRETDRLVLISQVKALEKFKTAVEEMSEKAEEEE